MKRILACLLSLSVILSVTFTVPVIFSKADTNDNIVVTNTFDETGYSYKDVKFDKSTNPIGVIVDGGVTGKGFKFNRIYCESYHSTDPYFNIYTNSGDFSVFVPQNGTYKLTLKYKSTKKFNYAANTLELRGIKDAKLSDSELLGEVFVVPRKTTVDDWTEAELTFNVNDSFNSLGLVLNSTVTGTSAQACNIYLDDIVIEKASTEEEDITILNTYDETGYTYKDIKFDKSANPIGVIVDGGVTGKALKFNRIYNTSYHNTLPYVNVYDNNNSSFSSFIPEKDTTYKLTLWYKSTKNFNYAENTLELRGVKDEKLSDSVVLGEIFVIPRKTTVDNWTMAELVFTVNSAGFKSLGLVLNSTVGGTSAQACDIYIDDISIEKFELLQTGTVNDYESPFIYKDINFTSNQNSPNGKVIPGEGLDGSRGFCFSRIYSADYCKVKPYVKIYNPLNGYNDLTPNKETTYRIRLKYRSTVSFNYANNTIGIYGINNADLSDAKRFGTVFTVARKTTVNDWTTAEIIFKTDSGDYSAFALVLESTVTGTSAHSAKIYLDDVDLADIPTGSTTLKTHNHMSDEITVPNETLFSDIAVEPVSGKKFEGWYLDKDFKTPAESIVYGHIEVWAKWRTSGDKIKNTYDDKGVYFGTDSNGYIKRYSDSTMQNCIESGFAYTPFAKGTVTSSKEYGRAISLNSASVISNTNPPLVRIYDNTKADKSIYTPRANTVYKISLSIKSTALLDNDTYIAVKAYDNLNGSFGAGQFLKYLHTLKEGTANGNWTEIEGYFTVHDSEYAFLGISLMTSATANKSGLEVWIDNITLTEVMDTDYITAHPNNGENDFILPFVEGNPLDTLPEIAKDGYVFAGWYKDSNFTVPFTYNKMSKGNIDIYAKWEKVTSQAEDFITGFESDDYNLGVTPYTNKGENNHYTNNMSAAVSLYTNSDEAYDGEKYLRFENESGSGRQTMDMAAVALVKPDGEYYQVKAGERYKISFALRSDSYCYIVPVVSDNVATAKLCLSNTTEIARVYYQYMWYHSLDTWGEMKGYFTPSVSGKVYLLVYYTCNYAEIDNLKLEVKSENEISIVKYYNEAGTGVARTSIGSVGEWLFPPVPATKEGYVFDGWYDKNGNQYVKSVFPKGDIKLYPRYREAVENENPDTLKKTLSVDFENDTGRTQAYYQSNKNSLITNNDAIFVSGDPNGAHSGSNYLKFYNAGQWTKSAYRRFRIYNSDSADNRIYLEPYSLYKVGFWMKVDKTWAAALRLATFDNTDSMEIISDETVVSLTEVETEDIYGEWKFYEGTITTGSDISTLGFMISGGFVTASFDDFTVRKMEKLTVSFDSNGGSAVEALETFEDQYVVAPIEPEKEGYIFDGWYSDKSFKNLFDFNNTLITKDIILYAKWKEIPIQQYKDVITYETEEIINILPIENPQLDEQLKVENIDKPAKKAVAEPKEEKNILPLIIAVIAVFAVLVVFVVLLIVLRKRKDKIRIGG